MVSVPQDSSSALIWNGCFMVSRWRRLLSAAAQTVSRSHDATCPFGFETTGDPSWLHRPLRRFYILLGGEVARGQSTDALAKAFYEQLLGEIRRCDPLFHDSIAMVRYNRQYDVRLKGARYVPTSTDVLLNILTLNDRRGSLAAYADYLISFMSSSEAGPHGEFQHFARHTRVRRRLFQLFLICARLSSALGLVTLFPPLPAGWNDPYSDEFQRFYAGDRESSPSDLEMEFYRSAIVPTFQSARDEMHRRTAAGPRHAFHATDFYSGRRIDCELARADYDTLCGFIFDTYSRYREES
jgi:hypothetical protein